MKLLTRQDAAEILGVTERTLNNLVHAGELPPPQRLGRRVYWLADEFEAFLRDRLSQNKQNQP